MKDPREVLRAKEQEILKVKKQIEALRIAAALLADQTPTTHEKVDLRQVIEMP